MLTLEKLFEKLATHTDNNNDNNMRTKTLLAAAILAGGLTAAMAQVYSLNVVGYVNVTVPANTIGGGFAIVANPLNKTNNDIAQVIPPASVPEGTAVYKWNNATSTYSTRIRTTDDDDNPIWSGALDLSPGIGFWIKNPTANPITITFVGEVLQGNLTNSIPAGFSMLASQVPQSGDLAAVLNYPAVDGSTVYFWRNGGYVTRIRTTDDDDNPIWSGPTVPGVGEGFWAKETTAKTWWRSFTVN